jgi:tetratricopeptide (TPR) repeat protein
MEASTLLAELNDDASHFIRGGDYKDAIHLLNCALKISMKLLVGGKQDACFYYGYDETVEEVPHPKTRNRIHRRSEESRGVSSHHHHHHSRRSKKKRTNTTSTTPVAAASPREEEAPSSPAAVDFHEFVYREPIHFHDRYNIPSIQELSLITMYNMALAQHLKAVEKKKVSKSRLMKVLQFYELANILEMTHGLQIGVTYSVAVLNNVAQIYRLVGREEKAQNIFKRLFNTLVYLVDGGNAGQIDQLEGFFLSVSHLIVKEAPVAVAA